MFVAQSHCLLILGFFHNDVKSNLFIDWLYMFYCLFCPISFVILTRYNRAITAISLLSFLRGIAQLNSVSYFFHPFVSLIQTLSQPSHNNNARDICLPDSGLHAELLSKDSIIMGFDCLSLNLNNWWLQYLPHYLCVVNIHYGSVFERGVWQRAQGSLAWGELLSVWLMTEMKKYLLITLEKGTVLRSLSAQYAF